MIQRTTHITGPPPVMLNSENAPSVAPVHVIVRRGFDMTKEFCKHYRGMHRKDRCEAGVSFAELEHYGTKQFHDSCPCFGPDHSGECEHKVYPTEAEIAEREAEIADRFAAIGKARAAIVEHLGGPWKRGQGGAVGAIECPVCNAGDALHFSRSGYNGHIHAKCQTPDCVSWME